MSALPINTRRALGLKQHCGVALGGSVNHASPVRIGVNMYKRGNDRGCTLCLTKPVYPYRPAMPATLNRLKQAEFQALVYGEWGA